MNPMVLVIVVFAAVAALVTGFMIVREWLNPPPEVLRKRAIKEYGRTKERLEATGEVGKKLTHALNQWLDALNRGNELDIAATAKSFAEARFEAEIIAPRLETILFLNAAAAYLNRELPK